MHKMRNWLLGAFVILLYTILWDCSLAQAEALSQPPASPSSQTAPSQKVVINEAVRTLLYLPLYHAKDKNYFAYQGLDVQIVTGGTATNSFAAMLSGEADFAQADPMYVPISREKGAKTKVVAQVVGRISLWGLAMNPKIQDMSADSLRGKRISTQPRPMTAYTYTVKTVRDAGLDPDKDVTILQSKPGTEIIPLLNKKSDFTVTIEPSASLAVNKGAHVVLSYPKLLGDQVFSALMTREDYIQKHPDIVLGIVKAYQLALTDIHQNPDSAVITGMKYFPQMQEAIVRRALKRLLEDGVFPKSVLISDESWGKAIAVRVNAGDIKSPSSAKENCALEVMTEAARVNK